MLHTCVIRKAGASCVSAAACRVVSVLDMMSSSTSVCFFQEPLADMCTPRYLNALLGSFLVV